MSSACDEFCRFWENIARIYRAMWKNRPENWKNKRKELEKEKPPGADGKKKRDLAQMLAGNARPLNRQEQERPCSSIVAQKCAKVNGKIKKRSLSRFAPAPFAQGSHLKCKGGFQKMSMTMQQMRAAVAALYPFDGWKAKVEKMPDGQILAIYNRQVLNKKGGGAT